MVSLHPQINILDMRGLNVGALTGKAMELTSKIAKIDQDNYPETLEACYIINPPWCESFFLIAFRAYGPPFQCCAGLRRLYCAGLFLRRSGW